MRILRLVFLVLCICALPGKCLASGGYRGAFSFSVPTNTETVAVFVSVDQSGAEVTDGLFGNSLKLSDPFEWRESADSTHSSFREVADVLTNYLDEFITIALVAEPSGGTKTLRILESELFYRSPNSFTWPRIVRCIELQLRSTSEDEGQYLLIGELELSPPRSWPATWGQVKVDLGLD